MRYIIDLDGQTAFSWRGSSALSTLVAFCEAALPGAHVERGRTRPDDQATVVVSLAPDRRHTLHAYRADGARA